MLVDGVSVDDGGGDLNVFRDEALVGLPLVKGVN